MQCAEDGLSPTEEQWTTFEGAKLHNNLARRQAKVSGRISPGCFSAAGPRGIAVQGGAGAGGARGMGQSPRFFENAASKISSLVYFALKKWAFFRRHWRKKRERGSGRRESRVGRREEERGDGEQEHPFSKSNRRRASREHPRERDPRRSRSSEDTSEADRRSTLANDSTQTGSASFRRTSNSRDRSQKMFQSSTTGVADRGSTLAKESTTGAADLPRNAVCEYLNISVAVRRSTLANDPTQTG